MTIDEFEPEHALLEISRKLSNVTIHNVPSYGETVERDTLPTARYLLYSSDFDQINSSIRILRRYLTQGHSDESSVNDILSLDILPRIKELIESSYDSITRFECAWIVTNIAAGTTEQTYTIIQAGFVDLLLSCLSDRNSSMELRAQAAWALGNIAGESPGYREELMKKGFTCMIVEMLNLIYDETYRDAMSSYRYSDQIQFANEEYYSNVEALLWSLSNMSRGGFYVAEYYQNYLPMFQVFSKFIIFDYIKLQIEICWGLSRILYNMHEVDEFHQQNHVSDELCERLSDLLCNGIPKVVVPVIRTIVNITSGPNDNVGGLLRAPLLTSITRLLEPQAPNELRKDAYLIISNLAAGDEDMIRYVVSNKFVMINVLAHITVPGHTYTADPPVWTPTISHAYYYKNDEWKVTKEALWIVFNIISMGSDAVVWEFVHDHENLPYALSALLNYIELPLDICEKLIESMTSLVQRSNKWVDQQRFPDGKNVYVTALIHGGVRKALPFVQQVHYNEYFRNACVKLDNLITASEAVGGYPETASMFGLPTLNEIRSKSTKRRVLRGFEDGDLRLIEHAVGSLCI